MASRDENIQRTKQQRQEALSAKYAGIEERRKERAKRSPQQQLERLDFMFGVGQGAKKERAKLLRKLQKSA